MLVEQKEVHTQNHKILSSCITGRSLSHPSSGSHGQGTWRKMRRPEDSFTQQRQSTLSRSGQPERSGPPGVFIWILTGFIGKCEGWINRFRSYYSSGSAHALTHNAYRKTHGVGGEYNDHVNRPRSFSDSSQCPLCKRQSGGFPGSTFHFRQRGGVIPPRKATGYHLSLPFCRSYFTNCLT